MVRSRCSLELSIRLCLDWGLGCCRVGRCRWGLGCCRVGRCERRQLGGVSCLVATWSASYGQRVGTRSHVVDAPGPRCHDVNALGGSIRPVGTPRWPRSRRDAGRQNGSAGSWCSSDAVTAQFRARGLGSHLAEDQTGWFGAVRKPRPPASAGSHWSSLDTQGAECAFRAAGIS